jgi:hypothetical protein
MELDKIPLWRGDHVPVKQLVEDFARYLYLPRLKDIAVLLQSINDGFPLLTWRQDTFGYAETFDESAGRYKGLRGGVFVNLSDAHSSALLVKSDVVSKQLDAEASDTTPAENQPKGGDETNLPGTPPPGDDARIPVRSAKPKRFHGAVVLDSARVGRDAGRIAEEVIAHLSGLVGANVTVTIEIEASIPDGVPEQVVRTVTENSKTLKFINQGFEAE